MRHLGRIIGALLVLACLSEPALADGILFFGIPAAKTPEEALATFEKRGSMILQATRWMDLGPYDFHNGGMFPTKAMARLAEGQDMDAVNRVILDPASVVYSAPGTDFQDADFLCRRTGDYDFMLKGLVPLMYHFGDNPALVSPPSRYKLLSNLLSQKGNQLHLKNNLWLCGVHDETENHILMTESSRYLTNQLMERAFKAVGQYQAIYDNSANGMTGWMLEHLQGFFKHDFSEYNAHPYQAYTVLAIQNLYEFSEDPRVKLAAEMLLNYLDAKYAISSNGLRRSVPFRRLKEYRDKTDLFTVDGESQRFALMAGNTQVFGDPFTFNGSVEYLVQAVLGSYRTPTMLLDLIMDKSRLGYFSLHHHSALEIYASSPSFLLSAGGIPIDGDLSWLTDQNAGWAVPTTLLPTAGETDRDHLIRFEGHRDWGKRINTCVAPGFACGLDPVVPKSIPESCIERGSGWTFVNFASAACPLQYGFYVALYSATCDTDRCRDGADRFGFLEAREADDEMDYATFKSKVLENTFRFYGAERPDEYVNSYGRHIRFVPLPEDKWSWSILGIDGQNYDTDLQHWPLARGDIMNADGSGLVEITNPRLRRKLTLDMRDFWNPKRTETSY